MAGLCEGGNELPSSLKVIFRELQLAVTTEDMRTDRPSCPRGLWRRAEARRLSRNREQLVNKSCCGEEEKDISGPRREGDDFR
ncbi:hypothetical protein ANN_11518 [Periplaneta americana]|uniref:Uncharacterized protein n=1 Tax=Periplaneta americana TaxID=6978 RepID=A0ABQ8T7J0_PERAM|nr:hypothetical protein ANN_11518 [Periplaneta americana]